MFSESQTLLDTTTYFKSSLYNLKVALELLSALQNWDGTVRVPFFPVAVFSKHCVCAQLIKEELSRSAVWLLLLSWDCQNNCSFTDPSFIKTAPSTCALGSSVAVSPFLGQTANTGWSGEASAGLCLGPLRNSHPTGQSPSVQSRSCQAACQWQQYRKQNSDQGDFNSTNYLLNQMDLVWKYPRHLHFQGFPTGTRWASCKINSKTNPPRKQSVSRRPSSYFSHLIFTNIGVYWLKPSQPSPCTSDNEKISVTTKFCGSEHPALFLKPVHLFMTGMWIHTTHVAGICMEHTTATSWIFTIGLCTTNMLKPQHKLHLL